MSVIPAYDFSGRVCLVIGGGGIIGRAIARLLGAGGATVGLADLEAPETFAKEITEQTPGQAVAIAVDVGRSQNVRECVDHVLKTFGRLDVLVAVAGVTSFGSFEDLSEEQWDRVQTINLKGVFLCNQAAIAPMKAQRYGRIVNIGSVLAKNGGNPRPWIDKAEQAGAANAAYGAAKAGVHALSLYLAREMATHNVTVNVVAPGPVASPMTEQLPGQLIERIPMGRLGTADDVAHAVAFLCSEQAGYITGEILDVNGGLWAD